LHSTCAKQPFQNAGNEVDHNRIVFLTQDVSQLTENGHTFSPYDKSRTLGDRRAFSLHVLAKSRYQFEYRVFKDVRWNVVMALPLVPDVNESVVYAHFKFGRILILLPLILIILFQAL
jgi:hypothetical protein